MIKKKFYFDYAATTPVASEVLKVMRPYFSEKYGNPGSLHSFGQEAMAAVDKARETIAKAINADFREIIFTGSATEANNLALRGAVKAYRTNKPNKPDKTNRTDGANRTYRIIVSAIEHESILETIKDLEKEGVEVLHLPVDRKGFVIVEKLKAALNERTILVSVMYVNNEIGTIQPITKISEIIRNFREELRIKNYELKDKNSKFKIQNSLFPLFHTDAVQAFQYLDCDVNKLGVDLMTLSAHKIYGPKGIGALYIKNPKHEILNLKQIRNPKFQNLKVSDLGFRISDLSVISPFIAGGGQEFGLRSGTENVPSIVGFAKAVELTVKNREKELKRMVELKNYFWRELKKIYPSAEINGMMNQKSGIRNKKSIIPNIINIYFPNHLAQDLLIKLDMAGIAVSAGAACSAHFLKPSHVLQALGFSPERIKNSLRFSFGKFTTETEIKEALKKIKHILK